MWTIRKPNSRYLVPFFGDQIFWGQMVKRAGAGPTPIPSKQLNEINLAAAIRFLLSNETAANARALGEKIRGEVSGDTRLGLTAGWLTTVDFGRMESRWPSTLSTAIFPST